MAAASVVGFPACPDLSGGPRGGAREGTRAQKTLPGGHLGMGRLDNENTPRSMGYCGPSERPVPDSATTCAFLRASGRPRPLNTSRGAFAGMRPLAARPAAGSANSHQ
eukprot:15442864-Alexandrium_andersonii.AAC.1